MSNNKKYNIPINKKDAIIYSTFGILTGLSTIALFYYIASELSRVFH